MCGRYRQIKTLEEIMDRFELEEYDIHAQYIKNIKNFNSSPSQELPVITNQEPKKLNFFRWGLIPSWAKDETIGYKTINARADTVAAKPSYRSSFKSKRCLVIADGFYEWAKTGAKKQPYLFSLKDDSLFAFAGLWETWDRGGTQLNSFTIITTEPNELCTKVHDRMPVILHRKDEQKWLDCDVQEAQNLLQPLEADLMTMKPFDPTNPIE